MLSPIDSATRGRDVVPQPLTEQMISDATELAERIVDRVIRPTQDWAEIERMAIELAELAGRANSS